MKKGNETICALLDKVMRQQREIDNYKEQISLMERQNSGMLNDYLVLKDENEKLRLALKALAESSKQKRVEELEEENRELKKQYDALVEYILSSGRRNADKIIPPVICPLMKDSIREWCYGKE